MDPAMAKERDENVAEARRIQVLNEQVGPASRFGAICMEVSRVVVGF